MQFYTYVFVIFVHGIVPPWSSWQVGLKQIARRVSYGLALWLLGTVTPSLLLTPVTVLERRYAESTIESKALLRYIDVSVVPTILIHVLGLM